jgi:hypothetical protein
MADPFAFNAKGGPASSYSGPPVLDYGGTRRASAYGDPNDAWGQAGNRFQNFAQGAAKTAAAFAPVAAIPGIGAPLVAVASGIGGIWNAFTAEDEQNKARQAEIEAAQRARAEFLAGKEYLTNQEKEQLALFDRNLAALEKDYENQIGLQESIRARQMQNIQQGYGGALGATGMSYAAAQPKLMRDLAARGMLGTGAEAAARGALAGQRASDIAQAAQDYSNKMSAAYENEALKRQGLLGNLSAGQAAIDASRTGFKRQLAAANLALEQGNRQAAQNLADQAAKDYAATQQQRGSDIFQGVTAVAGSPEFKTALGSAFGPAKAAAGGLGMPETSYKKFMSGDYGNDAMAKYYGYGDTPGGGGLPSVAASGRVGQGLASAFSPNVEPISNPTPDITNRRTSAMYRVNRRQNQLTPIDEFPVTNTAKAALPRQSDVYQGLLPPPPSLPRRQDSYPLDLIRNIPGVG